MKTIQITILAEDIRTSSYTNPDDCAMTRAIKRAGLDAFEGGGYIELGLDYIKTPKNLAERVKGMYKSLEPEKWIGRPTDSLIPIIEPADFTFDLEVPDHWINN